ncbi:hypothetical protein DFH27DRAFT_18865 [Peziza echinospora]|nr:hypothetical protein DFH27DRAFT_18865 [Peziza echinospora]
MNQSVVGICAFLCELHCWKQKEHVSQDAVVQWRALSFHMPNTSMMRSNSRSIDIVEIHDTSKKTPAFFPLRKRAYDTSFTVSRRRTTISRIQPSSHYLCTIILNLPAPQSPNLSNIYSQPFSSPFSQSVSPSKLIVRCDLSRELEWNVTFSRHRPYLNPRYPLYNFNVSTTVYIPRLAAENINMDVRILDQKQKRPEQNAVLQEISIITKW